MCRVDNLKLDTLKRTIFDSLMSMPDMGLGEMGEAYDEADRIVDEWVKENNIEVVE